MPPVVLSSEVLEALKARYALLQDVESSLSDLRLQQEKLSAQHAAISDGIMSLLERETGLPIQTQPFSVDLQRGLITTPDSVPEPAAELPAECATAAAPGDGGR